MEVINCWLVHEENVNNKAVFCQTLMTTRYIAFVVLDGPHTYIAGLYTALSMSILRVLLCFLYSAMVDPGHSTPFVKHNNYQN
jgi:hypothetical protein